MNAKFATALCSSLIVLATLLAAPAGRADDVPPSGGGDAPGRVSLDNAAPRTGPPVLSRVFGGPSGPVDYGRAVVVPFGPWIGMDGRFGNGPGWTDDYYKTNVFLPYHIDPGYIVMFNNANAAVTEEGDGVFNFSHGYRYYNESLDRVFGIAGSFDIDNGHADTYLRWGSSLESLGRWFDMRLNTYVIIGDDQNEVFDGFTGNTFFQGNFLLLERRKIIESAYSGGDFEIGGPVPFLGRYGLSSYIGGYLLLADEDEDTAGVRVRGEAQVTDDLTVGINYTYDDVFHANTMVNVMYTFPDGKASRWFRQRPVREKLAIPLEREWRVATKNRSIDRSAPLINPADGNPFTFAFISSTGSPGGPGTFENPTTFDAFANNANVDVILVSGGAQSRAGTLALLDNQRLLGAGVPHTIVGAQGAFLMGGTGTGITPELSNSLGGNIIQLANNNEVSGFDFTGAGLGNGIVAAPGGITNFNINRNTFTGLNNGVFLTNATGTGLVNQNTFTSNTIGFNLDVNNGGTLDLFFTNNDASANGTGALVTASGGSTINITANNNNFDDNTDPNTGFHAVADGAGTAINVASFQNNNVTDNINGNGVHFEATGGGAVALANFANNVFQGNGLNGVQLTGTGAGSTITGSIGVAGMNENFFLSNTGAGVGMNFTAGATLGAGGANPFRVENSRFGTGLATANLNGGINALATDSTFDLRVGNAAVAGRNIFDGNRDAGVAVQTLGTTVANVDFQNNLITNTFDNPGTTGNNNPGGDGVFLNRGADSVLNATIGNLAGGVNIFTSNAGAGVSVFGTGAAPVGNVSNINVAGNLFQQNTDGFVVDLEADVALTAEVQQNDFNQNVDGIRVTTANDSSFNDTLLANAATFDGNNFNDNTGTAIEMNASDNSTQNIEITGVSRRTTIVGGGNGITIATATGGAAPTYLIQGVDINLGRTGGGDGIGVTTFNSTNLTVGGAGALQSVNIVGAGDDGIAITKSGLGTLDLDLVNTSVTNSVDDGLNFVHSGGGFDADLDLVTSSFNSGRGFNIDVTNDGGDFDVFNSFFNNNTEQGVVIATADLTQDVNDSRIISVLPADQTSNLPDPFLVDINNAQYPNVSTENGAGTNDIYRDLAANVNFDFDYNGTNNEIRFNGADGMVLSAGSNTRLDVVLNDTFGGNVLADINFFPTASVNPQSDSVNRAAGQNDDVRLDPIARLNLTTTAVAQLLFNDEGSAGTASITRTGLFTNAGPFHATNRPVFLDVNLNIIP